MEKQKCHCNGSRGTDCDYCQGTGYRSEAFHLGGLSPKEISSTKVVSEKQVDIFHYFESKIKKYRIEIHKIHKSQSKEIKLSLRGKLSRFYTKLQAIDIVIKTKYKERYKNILNDYKGLNKALAHKFSQKNSKK